MIRCAELSFFYPETKALRHMNAAFSDARLHVILGPNGSGKSTLLSLIAGLLKPQEGSILVDGRRQSEYSRRELARHIALVPQSAAPAFDFTVRDIVLMGRYPLRKRGKAATREDYIKADEALDMLSLTALAHRNTEELSGGEWQRTLIARAICQETRNILLDEPTASLDLSYQLDVMKILTRLAHQEGRCIVAVVHSLTQAFHYADDILLISQGEQAAFGAPNAVLTMENMMRVYQVAAKIEALEDGRSEFVPRY